MKTMKKTCLIAFFVLLLACLFGAVGCGNPKTDNGEVGLTIDGAYDFTASGVLREKKTFSSSAEIAAIIEEVSGGTVTADAVADSIVQEGSAVYKIDLTELPSGVDLREYLADVERTYLALFKGWKSFPNSPVKYTTKDGKDVLVFLDHDAAKGATVSIFVLYFKAGSVDDLAACVGEQGGGNGNGNGGYVDDGNGGNGGNGNNEGGGNGESHGENGSSDEGSGEGQTEQDPPSQVRYTVYDVEKDGSLSVYMSDSVEYGFEISFDWCGFVVFEDVNFEREIDPNRKIRMESDIAVYRRDNCDKVPVFITIRYFVNDMELTGTVAYRTFFRGEIVTSSNFGGSEYEYYRGAKGEKMFTSGVEVIHESDDKLKVYAYREDPLYHKVTFKIGSNEIGTLPAYDGYVVGRYSAMDLGGTTQYEMLEYDVTESGAGDITVTITDYIVYHYVPITVNCCYNGDVKYSYVNYGWKDEEGRIEISAEMDMYTSADCTSRFVGYVTGSTTLYTPIGVELS